MPKIFSRSLEFARTSRRLLVLLLLVATAVLLVPPAETARAQTQYHFVFYITPVPSPVWTAGMHTVLVRLVNDGSTTIPAGTTLSFSGRMGTSHTRTLTPGAATVIGPVATIVGPCTPYASGGNGYSARLICNAKLNVPLVPGASFDTQYPFTLSAGPALTLGGANNELNACGDGHITSPGYSPTGGEITYCLNPVPASSACDDEAVMNGLQEVLPAGASDVTPIEGVDEDKGSVADLYPGQDTSTDQFYPLPCEPSLGGILPAAVNDPPDPNEVAAETVVDNFELKFGGSIASAISNAVLNLPSLTAFEIARCSIGKAPNVTFVPCDSTQFFDDSQPFEGRDIIYVHGLAIEHLKRHLANDPVAYKKWPQDTAEFLTPTGYYRKYAEDYWHDHLRENLWDPTSPASLSGYEWRSPATQPSYSAKFNRVLVVSWSSNQTLEYAQHTLLTQIKLAMTQGLNVHTPPNYPAKFSKPFCANGCILISHSTGGLIVTSAMGRASRGDFGPGGKQIAKYMRAHIAFEGAISGSRLATIALDIAMTSATGSAGATAVLCNIEDYLFDTANTCGHNTAFVGQSILRDLMPFVAQNVWGPAISLSPVPTVTVAGGHPIGNQNGITQFFLPGLDDGVVSMNSACGNPVKVQPNLKSASGAPVTSLLKAFDMGLVWSRSIRYFLAQKNYRGMPPLLNPARFLAAACTPHRSPTGMVMPILYDQAGTFWDARRRYPNIYSFIQAAQDHAHDGGGDPANRWPSVYSAAATVPRNYLDSASVTNAEETSAVTDPAIYALAPDGTYLVDPSFSPELHEYVKGRKRTFTLFGKKHTWWIWKRTYHRLNHWEDKASTHFAYEFVARR